MVGDSLVYESKAPISDKAKTQLQSFALSAGVLLEYVADGSAKITVAKAHRDSFFETFDEENVKNISHFEEAVARKAGGDGISEAKNYKSPLL